MTQELSPQEAYAERHPWPKFMSDLGLAPPVTAEDVRQAYEQKLAESPAKADRWQDAYQKALEYARFHASRRNWLSKQVERYVAQEIFLAELHEQGGRAVVESIDWLKLSIGEDFAQVIDVIKAVHLRGKEIGDEQIDLLVEHRDMLTSMRLLDLGGSRVSDDGLLKLADFPSLRLLDVENTPITSRGVTVLERLPKLEWIRLGGTNVGWWTQMALRWKYPRARIATAEDFLIADR